MTLPLAIRAYLSENHVQFIDLKCIDLLGRLHHITLPYEEGILERLTREGVGFDGSSYGFRKVENSDMVLIPDLETAFMDPFRTAPTLSFYSHIALTDEKRTAFSQDARAIARKAEAMLLETTGADTSRWGPEFEFYVFSDVDYDTRTSTSFYRVNHEEEFHQRAYHAANPFDCYDDLRDEASLLFMKLGIPVKYHHHEVGERGQQEIEIKFSDLLKTGDHIVTAKYILFNLAHQKNLHITFMPKPMYQQAGNGLHLHLYLMKQGMNAFYKKGAYGNFNEMGHFFMGGVLKHAAALAAFTNPSTNSYKRLVPGFEAPVALTYGRGNRASAIRIPKYISDPQKTRFEYRPPDATANPYLCLAAILLAGIDGVVNKIDPEKEGYGPMDILEEKKEIQYLPGNLESALSALKSDHDFLKRNQLFSDELLSQWTRVKEEEIKAIATMPHPFEYKMYFTL